MAVPTLKVFHLYYVSRSLSINRVNKSISFEVSCPFISKKRNRDYKDYRIFAKIKPIRKAAMMNRFDILILNGFPGLSEQK